MTAMDAVELFAGAGGASLGLTRAGLTRHVGLEWDHAACRAAVLAGHQRVRADVAAAHPEDWPARGLWASPGGPGVVTRRTAGRD